MVHELRGDSVGTITTAGEVTTYAERAYSPEYITEGPGGDMWFTNAGLNNETGALAPSIGQITPGGVVTLHKGYEHVKVGAPVGIAAIGGDLWYTDDGGYFSIDRMTAT